jgi:hypothetical protein
VNLTQLYTHSRDRQYDNRSSGTNGQPSERAVALCLRDNIWDRVAQTVVTDVIGRGHVAILDRDINHIERDTSRSSSGA